MSRFHTLMLSASLFALATAAPALAQSDGSADTAGSAASQTEAASGQSGSGQGRQPAEVQVDEEGRREVFVEQQPADVQVELPAPEIVIEQQPPTVTIHQPDPKVTIRLAQPKVTIVRNDGTRSELEVQMQGPSGGGQTSGAQAGTPESGQVQNGQVQNGRAQNGQASNDGRAEDASSGAQQAASQPTGSDAQSSAAGSGSQAGGASGQPAEADRPSAAGASGSAPSAEPQASGEEASGGAAQETADETQTAALPSDDPEAKLESVAQRLGVSAEELVGMDVENDTGEELGEVMAVLRSPDDRLFMLVQTQDFLGFGDTLAAVPADDFRRSDSGDGLILPNVTEEALEERGYDESDYDVLR